MISMRELSFALFGVWRLAHLDKSGLQHLDDSIDGFWKSFFAAAIVLPGALILRLLEGVPGADGVGDDTAGLRPLVAWGIAYVMHWTLYPIAVFYIAHEIGHREQYQRYIVAQNWASVLQVAITVPAVALLVLAGPNGLGGVLFLIVTVGLLFYSWFIAKTAFEVTGVVAVGLVILNVLLSLALNVATDRFAGI